jgi:hypothetical protein
VNLVLHYYVTNDVVYFPDTDETFVPVEVKEDGHVIRTELWTPEQVEDLVQAADSKFSIQ